VANALDACPGTPGGTKIDHTGCEADADSDGVPDSKDACPGTPHGAKVDAQGCHTDSDSDGVPDGRDRCPDTPAGASVDANGCPRTTDADRDGVLDASDKCPNTPLGRLVDRSGCPLARTVVLKGVHFDSGSAQLGLDEDSILDTVAKTLIANPALKIQIGGHTDSTGSRALNLRLSKERAEAVRQYLISKGVNAANLTAVGFGSSEPIGDDATAEGRAANRRAELKVIR
jgi:OOP family OmpA-OmpF porin